MVKTLDRVREWMRSLRMGRVCYFCYVHEREINPEGMHKHEGVLICPRCLRRPMAPYALDIVSWQRRPESIPPCRYCRKAVPMEDLVPASYTDGYFCSGCADDRKVIRAFRKLRERVEMRN